ncbi:MAG TPA: hypothetical protein ENJ51_01350 [Leucothrix mucor]|uniref:HPt domain-containing protein n=1 Tax=Leucothrix mucor TaxID=45248 RepID=A0A7V2T153_LEUMU|nr:hypothetical protein [Leucothrix mucor]
MEVKNSSRREADMSPIKHMILNDCGEYALNAKTSNQEILKNLEKVMTSLGRTKADNFLLTAFHLLQESVERLYLSIETNDASSCAHYAHKLRGSSNLYGSKLLKELLLEFIEQPVISIGNLDKCKRLVCEFELVLSILKSKIIVIILNKK